MYGGGTAANANASANAGASVVEVATGEPMHGASVIAMVWYTCLSRTPRTARKMLKFMIETGVKTVVETE